MAKETDDNLYIIEHIIRHRRTPGGILQYLVKWLNYSSKENSWIPAEYFYSQKMVDIYNKQHNLEDKSHTRRHAEQLQPNSSSMERPTFVDLLPHEEYSPGGTLGRMIELHQHHVHGRLALVEWQRMANCTVSFEQELVPIEWMNVQYPQLVIEFYESRVFFRNKTGNLEKCRGH